MLSGTRVGQDWAAQCATTRCSAAQRLRGNVAPRYLYHAEQRELLVHLGDRVRVYRELDGEALAEERRLFYVALTRAAEALVLIGPPAEAAPGRAARRVPSPSPGSSAGSPRDSSKRSTQGTAPRSCTSSSTDYSEADKRRTMAISLQLQVAVGLRRRPARRPEQERRAARPQRCACRYVRKVMSHEVHPGERHEYRQGEKHDTQLAPPVS